MPYSRLFKNSFHALILVLLVFTALPSPPARAATFTVTKIADTNDGICNADCSLREAVFQANNTLGADTITLPAGTYLLTLGGSGENANATGDLDVSDSGGNSLTIVGAGENSTIIQQTTADRVFHILSGDFNISAVTVSNGNVSGDGGGIFNDVASNMTIDNVIFSNNFANGSFGGGAIRAFSGTIIISESIFSNNTASNSNGGGAILFGGGESSPAVATITNSTFSGNATAGQFGSGGAINSSANPLTITGSTFTNNRANSSHAFVDSNGGAFNMDSGDASTRIANSTFSGNSAADYGGALFVRDDGNLTVINITVASNTADNDLDGVGDGGGLYVQEMENGISINPSVGNTILAGNMDTGGEMPDCGGDGANHFDSAGNNFIQSLTGCIFGGTNAGNITNADPLLAALADNGGLTQTHALQTGSLAINAGNNALCAAAPVSNKDQRGFTRPEGAACDIGAFEVTTPIIVMSTTLSASSTVPGPLNFNVVYNKAASDPAGNSDTDDVTNPANYLIVSKGVNGVTNTVSCAGGVVTDDIQVTVSNVTYNAATFTATVTLASPLPAGAYRLFVCGTTSIVDNNATPLTGDGATPGTDFTFDFIVSGAPVVPLTPTTSDVTTLPKTGFAPLKVTVLPLQPENLAYEKMGDLWLEVPSQNIQANILGVPKSGKNWDTTWLGNNIGWLNGTAFPSWEGNSVLTGHVYNADGLPGPFANLKSLKYGDTIILHMDGQRYIFEVRKSLLVRPYSTGYALEHLEDYSYLTLITCQGYNSMNGVYYLRRVVRAVLVRVEADK